LREILQKVLFCPPVPCHSPVLRAPHLLVENDALLSLQLALLDKLGRHQQCVWTNPLGPFCREISLRFAPTPLPHSGDRKRKTPETPPSPREKGAPIMPLHLQPSPSHTQSQHPQSPQGGLGALFSRMEKKKEKDKRRKKPVTICVRQAHPVS